MQVEEMAERVFAKLLLVLLALLGGPLVSVEKPVH